MEKKILKEILEQEREGEERNRNCKHYREQSPFVGSYWQCAIVKSSVLWCGGCDKFEEVI